VAERVVDTLNGNAGMIDTQKMMTKVRDYVRVDKEVVCGGGAEMACVDCGGTVVGMLQEPKDVLLRLRRETAAGTNHQWEPQFEFTTR